MVVVKLECCMQENVNKSRYMQSECLLVQSLRKSMWDFLKRMGILNSRSTYTNLRHVPKRHSRHLLNYIHCLFNHNSQRLEINQMSVNGSLENIILSEIYQTQKDKQGTFFAYMSVLAVKTLISMLQSLQPHGFSTEQEIAGGDGFSQKGEIEQTVVKG